MPSSTVYQREYYQKNITKLREKAKERARVKRAIIKNLINSNVSAQPRSAISWVSSVSQIPLLLEIVFIVPLLILVTFLLFRELVDFYSDPQGAPWLPWIKAITMEGLALFFSFANHTTFIAKLTYRLLAVCLVVMSTYAMTSRHFSEGMELYRANQITEHAVSDLEIAINEKRVQRDNLIAKGWISAARKMEKNIDTLREKLVILRANLTHGKPATAIASNALSQILLRVLLSISNLFLAHQFGRSLKQLDLFTREIKSSKPSIETSGQILKFQSPKKHNNKPIEEIQTSVLKTLGISIEKWGRNLETG